jgi:hypothetical protein
MRNGNPSRFIAWLNSDQFSSTQCLLTFKIRLILKPIQILKLFPKRKDLTLPPQNINFWKYIQKGFFYHKYSEIVTALTALTSHYMYRLRFGSSLPFKSVFHLNRLTAQLSYEGRAAVEGGKYSSVSKFHHHKII